MIVYTNSADFYHGKLAQKIDAFSRKYGGYLRQNDLESFTPKWVNPVKINYWEYNIWEIPK